MLGKTHVAVGVATALAIVQPSSTTEFIETIAGGALGGWISDIDVRDSDIDEESIPGLILSGAIFSLGLWIEYKLGSGVFDFWNNVSLFRIIIGALLFALCSVYGFISSHRTFTHSILGIGLLVFASYLSCQPLALPFLIGIVSHVVLDLFNGRGLQIFFPLDFDVCFDVCASNEKANFILMMGGTITSVVLSGWFLALNISNLQLSTNEVVFLGLDRFQLYLIIINSITFIALCIDHWVFFDSDIDYDEDDEDFIHTLLDILALAGGALGMLLSLLFYRQSIGKHNANWYAVVISLLAIWTTIYFVAYDPFNLGYYVIADALHAYSWIMIYLAIINIATFILFVIDRDSVRSHWSIFEGILFMLGILGGAFGGLIAITITHRKASSPHFAFGFPVLLSMQSFIIGYLVLNGII